MPNVAQHKLYTGIPAKLVYTRREQQVCTVAAHKPELLRRTSEHDRAEHYPAGLESHARMLSAAYRADIGDRCVAHRKDRSGVCHSVRLKQRQLLDRGHGKICSLRLTVRIYHSDKILLTQMSGCVLVDPAAEFIKITAPQRQSRRHLVTAEAHKKIRA